MNQLMNCKNYFDQSEMCISAGRNIHPSDDGEMEFRIPFQRNIKAQEYFKSIISVIKFFIYVTPN